MGPSLAAAAAAVGRQQAEAHWVVAAGLERPLAAAAAAAPVGLAALPREVRAGLGG